MTPGNQRRVFHLPSGHSPFGDRRRFLLILGAVAALGIAYAAFPSAEARIIKSLRELARALSRAGDGVGQAELSAVLAAELAPSVTVRAPEFALSGTSEVSAFLAQTLNKSEPFTIALEQVDVAVDGGADRARASVLASMTTHGAAQMRDQRRALIRYRRLSGSWRIESVELSASLHEQPEARP